MTEAHTEPPTDENENEADPDREYQIPDYEPGRRYLAPVDELIIKFAAEHPWTPKNLSDKINDAQPERPRGREYVNEEMISLLDHGLLDRWGQGLYHITDKGRRRYIYEFGDEIEIETLADFAAAYDFETVDVVLARYREWADATADADEDAREDVLFDFAEELQIRPDHLAVAFDEIERRIEDGDAGGAETLFQRS